MTRKDYVLLADAIARAYADLLPSPADDIADATTRELQSAYNRVGARAVARRVADALSAENPRFDTSRFLRAAISDAYETSTYTLNADITNSITEGA